MQSRVLTRSFPISNHDDDNDGGPDDDPAGGPDAVPEHRGLPLGQVWQELEQAERAGRLEEGRGRTGPGTLWLRKSSFAKGWTGRLLVCRVSGKREKSLYESLGLSVFNLHTIHFSLFSVVNIDFKVNYGSFNIYCLSKKSWPIWYKLHIFGQAFLDIQLDLLLWIQTAMNEEGAFAKVVQARAVFTIRKC